MRDLLFDADEATVSGGGYKRVSVSVVDANVSSILDTIGLEDVLNHFGYSEVLDEIGKEPCMTHFDLTEQTEIEE